MNYKFLKSYLFLHLLAMTVVVIVAVTGVYVWLSNYTRNGEEIAVPNIIGMDYMEAVALLEQKGLFATVTDSGYNKHAAASSILAQTPVAGSKVKEGRTVYVTVNSLYSPRLPMPDLIDNCSYREAQARLQAMGFRLTAPRMVDGEKDWVYGIEVNGRSVVGGDMISIEAPVTLVVGQSMEDEDEWESDINDTIE